jgi:hypothetical protein
MSVSSVDESLPHPSKVVKEPRDDTSEAATSVPTQLKRIVGMKSDESVDEEGNVVPSTRRRAKKHSPPPSSLSKPSSPHPQPRVFVRDSARHPLTVRKQNVPVKSKVFSPPRRSPSSPVDLYEVKNYNPERRAQSTEPTNVERYIADQMDALTEEFQKKELAMRKELLKRLGPPVVRPSTLHVGSRSGDAQSKKIVQLNFSPKNSPPPKPDQATKEMFSQMYFGNNRKSRNSKSNPKLSPSPQRIPCIPIPKNSVADQLEELSFDDLVGEMQLRLGNDPSKSTALVDGLAPYVDTKAIENDRTPAKLPNRRVSQLSKMFQRRNYDIQRPVTPIMTRTVRSPTPPMMSQRTRKNEQLTRFHRPNDDLDDQWEEYAERTNNKPLPIAFLKGVKISPFTGEKGQYFGEWIETFERHLETMRVPLDCRPKALKAYLKGSASRRAARMDPRISNSYPRLCEALREEFDAASDSVRQNNIALLSQKPKESALEFARRVQDEVDLAYPRTDSLTRETLAVVQIAKGVRPEYIMKVPAISVARTMTEMKQHLLTFETANKFSRGTFAQNAFSPEYKKRARSRGRDSNPFSINQLALETDLKETASQVTLPTRSETDSLMLLTKDDTDQVQQMIKADRADLDNVIGQLKDDLTGQVKNLTDTVRRVAGNRTIHRPYAPPDNRGSRYRPPVGQLSEKFCWKCGEKGHMSFTCRLLRQNEAGRKAYERAMGMEQQPNSRPQYRNQNAQNIQVMALDTPDEECSEYEYDFCQCCETDCFKKSYSGDSSDSPSCPEERFLGVLMQDTPEETNEKCKEKRNRVTREIL